MCVTCGCSNGGEVTIIAPHGGQHTHILADGTVVNHAHSPDAHGHGPTAHPHSHPHPELPIPTESGSALAKGVQDMNGASLLHAHPHGTAIALEQNLLAKNDLIAAQNRGWLRGRHTLALNLVSSPGSGKTTLLTRTLQDLKQELPISVIEGDQATSHDAQRIQETGCLAVQINTGTGCHLEAAMVERGLQQLDPPPHSVVMIENVGNLVCPALFDLGEYAKVVILSVTEGEDKPVKYPHMFRAAQVMILTKVDLLPYVPFDRDRCLEYARQVNPHLTVFQVSSTSGEGLEEWYGWLRNTARSI